MNKLTKAELMLKLKKLQQTTQESKNNGIIAKLLLFKSLILKITLIAIIIKTFKRYSILRKIWTVINTIIVYHGSIPCWFLNFRLFNNLISKIYKIALIFFSWSLPYTKQQTILTILSLKIFYSLFYNFGLFLICF